ncbi:MAG: DNA repair protein RadA [Cyanobacteriota bacterium]
MAKIKSKWVCQVCEYETASYLGKCPECESWSSFKEELIQAKSSLKNSNMIDNYDSYFAPRLLKDVNVDTEVYFSTCYSEFDRVLGKGIVENSLILLGGDPGIGKSTILLQVCGQLSSQGIKTLYVSAEESPKQIKLRAERIGISSENLFVFAQTNLNFIIDEARKLEPKVIIIDSIQAIYDPELSSAPGSISQIRECSNRLLNLAKYGSASIFLIGHVTKEGAIAGPKVLEHIVDTVLYLEGDAYKSYRILRTVKNRYGSTNEIGVFNMIDKGLVEVCNPSELFLSQRSEANAPGSVVISTMEGTRALLVEVQALVGPTSYAAPRRVATGLEYNRLQQILAVLEKRVGLSLSKYDVYASIVGGLTINEPSADLGTALSVVSSVRNIIIDKNTVVVGEIGLTGEVRAISGVEARVNEAVKQGFKKILIPEANLTDDLKNKNIEIVGVNRLIEAISKSILIPQEAK